MMHWLAHGWLRQARRQPSPNQGKRPPGCAVSLVVVHAISLPPGEFGGDAVERFFLNRLPAGEHPYFAEIAALQVSAHFFVRRGGEVLQFVSCDRRAWHAGRSAWRGRQDCNDFSVGIELEGCDGRGFEAPQYAALVDLVAALARRYPITAIAGHSDIAPGRKTDPGPGFDWAPLRQAFPGLDYPVA